MMMVENGNDSTRTSIHWPSVFQLGLSLIGISLLWSMALLLVGLGLLGRTSLEITVDRGLTFLLMGAAAGLIGLMLFPSAGYAFLRLSGRESTQSAHLPRWLRPTWLIFAFPLVLGAGAWAARQESLDWILLPPLHILALGIPILWIAYLAGRDLPVGSPQRLWGLLASGSALAPFLILLVETFAMLGGVILWSAWASNEPDIVNELSTLAQMLENSSNSPELLLHALTPYLREPLVIYSIFTFGAVLVPLIEEALKPLGVWLLAGSGLSPAEGFTAGVLSGAAYSLAESLLLASNGGTEWASLVFARLGTGVVHSLTSGLTGWALVHAWREGTYLRLGLAYLGAVLIHGLWNALTLLMVFAIFNQGTAWPYQADRWAPYGLVGIAMIGMAALLWINANLRRQIVAKQDVV